MRAIRLVERNALVYRRIWRGSFFGSFLQPTLFLFAFGVGRPFKDTPGLKDWIPVPSSTKAEASSPTRAE